MYIMEPHPISGKTFSSDS